MVVLARGGTRRGRRSRPRPHALLAIRIPWWRCVRGPVPPQRKFHVVPHAHPGNRSPVFQERPDQAHPIAAVHSERQSARRLDLARRTAGPCTSSMPDASHERRPARRGPPYHRPARHRRRGDQNPARRTITSMYISPQPPRSMLTAGAAKLHRTETSGNAGDRLGRFVSTGSAPIRHLS